MPVVFAANPVVKAAHTVSVKSPVKAVAAVPVVMASSASESAASQESFIAVQGVAVSGTILTAGTAPATVSTPEDNPVQAAAASPRQLANDFYLIVIGIIAVALLLNIFIKIRMQFPDLIFGGVSVVAVAALFMVLNQHLFFLHGVVF